MEGVHRGKKLLQDLHNLENAAMKWTLVRFGGPREKGAMSFVKCPGVSREDTMEGPLWRETLTGAWGRMTRQNLLVGCVMVIFAGKKPSFSPLYRAQRQDGAVLPAIECSTRHWLDPFSRAWYSLLLKTHGPSERELADKIAD